MCCYERNMDLWWKRFKFRTVTDMRKQAQTELDVTWRTAVIPERVMTGVTWRTGVTTERVMTGVTWRTAVTTERVMTYNLRVVRRISEWQAVPVSLRWTLRGVRRLISLQVGGKHCAELLITTRHSGVLGDSTVIRFQINRRCWDQLCYSRIV
jgi:hypothetical protein